MSCKNRTEAKSIPVCGTGATVLDELSYKKKEVTFKDDTAKYVISRKWSLVDDMEVFNAGCEYGVYEE